MSIFCEKAFEKEFEDEISKQAYLNACKWLAINIYNNVELSKSVVISIEKAAGRELPTFVVTVYARIDEKEQREAHCKKCKMLHTIFYSMNGVNCSECKAKAYFKYLDDNITNVKNFVREILEDKEEGQK